MRAERFWGPDPDRRRQRLPRFESDVHRKNVDRHFFGNPVLGKLPKRGIGDDRKRKQSFARLVPTSGQRNDTGMVMNLKMIEIQLMVWFLSNYNVILQCLLVQAR